MQEFKKVYKKFQCNQAHIGEKPYQCHPDHIRKKNAKMKLGYNPLEKNLL